MIVTPKQQQERARAYAEYIRSISPFAAIETTGKIKFPVVSNNGNGQGVAIIILLTFAGAAAFALLFNKGKII